MIHLSLRSENQTIMRSKRTILWLLTTIIVSVAAVAQKPGYTRYRNTKYVYENGQVSENNGGGGAWVKLDGNVLWIDGGYGFEDRYVFDSRRSDGSLLYYRTAWNYGTIYQGSGWQINYNSWAIVSPDHRVINTKNGNITTVMMIQSADDVGGMIE